MSRQFQQRRMEANRIARTFQHSAFEVVVQQHSGNGVKRSEGLDMAANEVVHRSPQIKAQEQPPRIRQHHHEGHQRTHGAPHGELTEVRPIGLSLLAWQGAQPQVGFGGGPRAQLCHQRAEVIRAAGVAAFTHHGMEPGGAQRRILGQSLDHERPIRIHDRAVRGGLRCGHAGLSEHPAHGAVMKSQLRGDGADDPMFDLIKPQDLGLDLARDHRAPPRSPATAQRPPSGESRQRTSTEAAAVRKGGHERVIRAGLARTQPRLQRAGRLWG